MGTDLPAWMRYGSMEWPLRLRMLFTGYVTPLMVTSWLSMTSWMAPPISPRRASMPAARMPALVAARTASRSGSNCGSNATVHAQSMMWPLICTPKSTFITSPAPSTVSSPGLGV